MIFQYHYTSAPSRKYEYRLSALFRRRGVAHRLKGAALGALRSLRRRKIALALCYRHLRDGALAAFKNLATPKLPRAIKIRDLVTIELDLFLAKKNWTWAKLERL